jgi:hypothetical protein
MVRLLPVTAADASVLQLVTTRFGRPVFVEDDDFVWVHV